MSEDFDSYHYVINIRKNEIEARKNGHEVAAETYRGHLDGLSCAVGQQLVDKSETNRTDQIFGGLIEEI